MGLQNELTFAAVTFTGYTVVNRTAGILQREFAVVAQDEIIEPQIVLKR